MIKNINEIKSGSTFYVVDKFGEAQTFDFIKIRDFISCTGKTMVAAIISPDKIHYYDLEWFYPYEILEYGFVLVI